MVEVRYTGFGSCVLIVVGEYLYQSQFILFTFNQLAVLTKLFKLPPGVEDTKLILRVDTGIVEPFHVRCQIGDLHGEIIQLPIHLSKPILYLIQYRVFLGEEGQDHINH